MRKVETISSDPAQNRLLIAGEQEKVLKVYTLDGRFTGEVVGRDLFRYEPEGLVLYACGDSTGYWVGTDQDEERNTFHVLDRQTLQPLGSFAGASTANTDGIALTQRGFEPFPEGALYAVHDDGSVHALRWADVARALNLRRDCTE